MAFVLATALLAMSSPFTDVFGALSASVTSQGGRRLVARFPTPSLHGGEATAVLVCGSPGVRPSRVSLQPSESASRQDLEIIPTSAQCVSARLKIPKVHQFRILVILTPGDEGVFQFFPQPRSHEIVELGTESNGRNFGNLQIENSSESQAAMVVCSTSLAKFVSASVETECKPKTVMSVLPRFDGCAVLGAYPFESGCGYTVKASTRSEDFVWSFRIP